MKEPTLASAKSEKTPQERFEELGKKLMAVPRDEVATLEKKWQQARKRRRKRA